MTTMKFGTPAQRVIIAFVSLLTLLPPLFFCEIFASRNTVTATNDETNFKLTIGVPVVAHVNGIHLFARQSAYSPTFGLIVMCSVFVFPIASRIAEICKQAGCYPKGQLYVLRLVNTWSLIPVVLMSVVILKLSKMPMMPSIELKMGFWLLVLSEIAIQCLWFSKDPMKNAETEEKEKNAATSKKHVSTCKLLLFACASLLVFGWASDFFSIGVANGMLSRLGVTSIPSYSQLEHGPFSILHGIQTLAADGKGLVAVLLFCFSGLFPACKITLIWLRLTSESLRQNKSLAFFLDFAGPWSMLDCLFVAVIGTAITAVPFLHLRVTLHPGFWAFALSIVLTSVVAKIA